MGVGGEYRKHYGGRDKIGMLYLESQHSTISLHQDA